ncbi:hypothetical protein LTR94_024362 [Friedmanniomyces endolithicus]|nr:hypothetical protein LTR94_024362 [Friedmanniomyces endolithicus]
MRADLLRWFRAHNGAQVWTKARRGTTSRLQSMTGGQHAVAPQASGSCRGAYIWRHSPRGQIFESDMTDNIDWEYQQLTLKARLAEVDGDAFETLFGDIAKAAWGADYVKTIPMGRLGDRKCDGFRQSEGAAHQLYGPRYGQANVKEALAKIDEDFRGAHAKWGDQLRKLSLTLNVPAEIWTRDEILALAQTLPPLARRELFGVAPNRTDMVREVTYANIGRALTAIRRHEAVAPLDPVALPPKVLLKADFNCLSSPVKRFLGLGQTGAESVRLYQKDQVDPSEAQRMADGFRERYRTVVVEGAEPDAAFGKMLRYAGGGSTDPGREAAALAVVAHFFSTCEIFDRPPADWQPA